MSFSYVQGNRGTFPISLTTAVAVGDLIVVSAVSNATSYGTITDNVNTGAYAQPSILQVENPGAAVGATAVAYIVCNTAGASGLTVSSSQAGSTGTVDHFSVSSGTPTLDTGACATATGNDVSPVNNGATAGYTPEVLIGAYSTNNVGSPTPSGWTLGSGTCYQLGASAGPFTFDLTFSSASKVASIVAGFYAAAGGHTPGGFFFAANRPKLPVAAAAMFMPLAWAIGRRNKRAGERRIVVPGDK
jgi:hypothetical protein